MFIGTINYYYVKLFLKFLCMLIRTMNFNYVNYVNYSS